MHVNGLHESIENSIINSDIERETEKKRLVISAIIAGIFVMLLGVTFIYDVFFDLKLYRFGLRPRNPEGLIGIVAAPFIHGDFNHLGSNIIPLFILGACMTFFYRGIAFRVILWIWLFTGIAVWLFARPSTHIGASGIVYGMASFLALSGMLRNDTRLISVSFLTIFLYGGMVWGVLPLFKHISWESHLAGALIGLICAVVYRHEGPPKPVYLSPNDEEEMPEEPEPGTVTVIHNTAQTENGIVHHTGNLPVRIIYIIAPSNKEGEQSEKKDG
jgi:membrane associated rhomboid family serine protease